MKKKFSPPILEEIELKSLSTLCTSELNQTDGLFDPLTESDDPNPWSDLY